MAKATDLFDYDVLDPDGSRIGTIEAVWEDATTGQREFLGIRATWLVGRIHLVPAQEATFDPARRQALLPWRVQQVREAPAFPPDAVIQPSEEARIYQHFGLGSGARPEGSGAVPGVGHAGEPHAHRAVRHDEHLHPGSWPRGPGSP